MKKLIFTQLVFITLLFLTVFGNASAQGPGGKDFGFGLIIGEPTGGTIKYWLNNENALVADIGYSYFGAPRIDIDYLWHFPAFRSTVVKLYAAFGAAVGFGSGYYGVFYSHKFKDDERRFYYRSYYGTDIGFGIRAMFGLNIIPKRTPLEFFLEVGPLIGLYPFGVAVDAAIGVRFYP